MAGATIRSVLIPSRAALLSALCLIACDGALPVTTTATDASVDAGISARDALTPQGSCATDDDPDGDGIASSVEGRGDSDRDDVPDAMDPDSDNDGIPDAFEANAGAPRGCLDPLRDSDNDGTPDTADTDANGDSLRDADQVAPSLVQYTGEAPAAGCLSLDDPGVQRRAVNGWACAPWDTDRDGVPDYADLDADGDRIANAVEISGAAEAPDTDDDGIPDWRDIDSDGDGVPDLNEGSADLDGDGVANFRDLDSDGDGDKTGRGGDSQEAGDADPTTPPAECALELDARARELGNPRPDGVPDYLDNDSDNDGLSDNEEDLLGTGRCDPDSDDDGVIDSIESAWCADQVLLGCATDARRRPPEDALYLLLPWQGAPVRREVEFVASLRAADVLMLVDSTASMGPTLRAMQSSLGALRGGLVERLTARLPDTWLGLNHYEDFPVSPYGASSDRVLHPFCAGPPGTPGCMSGQGITLQPALRVSDLAATAGAIRLGEGGDPADSQIEALYQSITGEGLFTPSEPRGCVEQRGGAPCWVPPAQCPAGTRGGACFRASALPVVMLFTDGEFHQGAPDPGTTRAFSLYGGLAPRPHDLTDLAAASARLGAVVLGFNANPAVRCEGPSPLSRRPGSPCLDLHALASVTGSVDREGRPFVFDLPEGSSLEEGFTSRVATAFEAVTLRLPFDVSTVVRNDSANTNNIDASAMVRRRVTSCAERMTTEGCWTAPEGVAPRDAVARADLTTLYRTVPGTRVRFTVTFGNNSVEGDPRGSTRLRLFLDAVGSGSAPLASREVRVIVPPRPL